MPIAAEYPLAGQPGFEYGDRPFRADRTAVAVLIDYFAPGAVYAGFGHDDVPWWVADVSSIGRYRLTPIG